MPKKKTSTPSTADLWNDPLFQLRRAEVEIKLLRESAQATGRWEARRYIEAQKALDSHEHTILKVLAKNQNILFVQTDIESGVNITQKTVGVKLRSLRGKGFVSQPSGSRAGWAITQEGLAALKPKKDAKSSQ